MKNPYFYYHENYRVIRVYNIHSFRYETTVYDSYSFFQKIINEEKKLLFGSLFLLILEIIATIHFYFVVLENTYVSNTDNNQYFLSFKI